MLRHFLKGSYLLAVLLAFIALGNMGSFSAGPAIAIAATPGPNFSISANPARLTVSLGGSNRSTILLQGTRGFTGDLVLTASTQTPDLQALLHPQHVTLSGVNTRAVSNLTVSSSLLTPPGNYSVTVSATDMTLTHTVQVPVIVRRAQQSFTVVTNCGLATAGKPLTCNASTIGGTQPFTFSWAALGGSPETGTGSSFTTTYPAKGTGMVNVTATDSASRTASGSTTITVTAQPLTVNVSCGRATGGKPVTCDALATGGTSPYTVSWSATNGSPSAGTSNSFTTIFSLKGTDTVAATVTDANGVTGSRSAGITVAAQALVPDFTFTPAIPASGETVTFTGTVTGGTAPYSYNWDFGDSATGVGSPATHVYSLTATTAFHVVLTATDSNGGSATGIHKITISSAKILVTLTCGSATAATPVDCNAVAAGGTGHFTFSWSALNGNPSSGSGAGFTTTFSPKGNYTVTAIATDSNGAEGSGSTIVVVSAQILSIDFTFTPVSPSSGQSVTFTATVAVSSYQLVWDFGDGAAGTDNPVQHVYSVNSPTSFNVTLTATSADGSGTASHSITVTAPTNSPSGNPPPVESSPTSPSPPNPLFGINWPLAALIAGNLIMAALALTQIPALRRKRTKREASS